jgi:hypothetical protein
VSGFEHTLYVLPPVLENGEVTWYGYLDEPARWHRRFGEAHFLMEAAGALLRKLFAYEFTPSPAGPRRNPNQNAGTNPDVPNIPAKWTLEVTAEMESGRPHWTVRLLDESMWERTDVALDAMFDKLAHRFAVQAPDPQPVLSRVTRPALPPAVPPAIIRAPAPVAATLPAISSESRFTDVLSQSILPRISAEIAEQEAEEIPLVGLSRRAVLLMARQTIQSESQHAPIRDQLKKLGFDAFAALIEKWPQSVWDDDDLKELEQMSLVEILQFCVLVKLLPHIHDRTEQKGDPWLLTWFLDGTHTPEKWGAGGTIKPRYFEEAAVAAVGG